MVKGKAAGRKQETNCSRLKKRFLWCFNNLPPSSLLIPDKSPHPQRALLGQRTETEITWDKYPMQLFFY